MPPEVEEARDAGLFALPERPPADARERPALEPEAAVLLTEGVWRVPVLLVSFSDVPPLYEASRFAPLLFDTLGVNPAGSMSEYYREVSRGKLRIVGEVFGWYVMPDTRADYGSGAYGLDRTGYPGNDAGLVHHAVQAADADVDFSRYDRDGDGEVDVVLVVHVGPGAEVTAGDHDNLWSVSSQLSRGWAGVTADTTLDLRPGSTTQRMLVDRFCILPERSSVDIDSLAEIGVYAHEFGHVLGWPDLYDASTLGGGRNKGPGSWCLMSFGAFGGDGQSPWRPTRPCAWSLMDAGWVPVENLTESGPLQIPPIDAPDGRAYRLWWEGEPSPEYFLLENRVPRGYDADQPAGGLLVYHVEENVIASRRPSNRVNSGSVPGLRVEEADGQYHLVVGLTHGDDGDPFPGSTGNTRFDDDTQPSTRSYLLRCTNVMLSEIEQDGDLVRAWVQVGPTGWSEPERHALPQRFELKEARPLARAGSHVHLLGVNASDSSRVYALARAYDLAWGPLERVSAVAGASEPSWADPSGGPLAAVWADRGYGSPEISYRVWGSPRGEERRATFSPGSASLPGAAWLPGGQLGVAWLDTREGKSQVYFKRFVPGAEAGATEARVSSPGLTQEVLDLALARAPNGRLALAYTARGPGVDEVYFQRFHADSGWTAPQQLSQLDGYASGSPDILVLPDGYVRIAWRDLTPTRTSIQSVLFSTDFVPQPEPPTLFTSLLSLPSLHLGALGAGGLTQVIARASEPPFDRVLVGGQQEDGAWDHGLGWISEGDEAGGSTPVLDTDPEGRITAIWTTAGAGGSEIWSRRRVVPMAEPVAVETPLASAPALSATPNPARGLVRFRGGAGAADAVVRLSSPAGRRVASIPLAGGEARWLGRDDAGTPLPSGIYFYRLESARGLPLSAGGKVVWLR